jgi:hypothetical protein
MRQWTDRNRNVNGKATAAHAMDCLDETVIYNPRNIAKGAMSEHYGQTSIASGEVTKR